MSRFVLDCAVVFLVAAVTYSYFGGKDDKSSIRGKRVFVTGASQNIGEEAAYQYAKLGAKVLVTARRGDVLKKVTEKCIELGAEDAKYIVADMSDRNIYESVIKDAVENLGGLDILVLNHVISRHGYWNGSKEEIEFLERSVTINYLSYVRLATAAMPFLKKSEGQLIVVSSQAGRPGLPNLAAYGATKAAITNFFTSVQMEIIKREERFPSITICYLGAINTDRPRWVHTSEKINVQGYPMSDTVEGIIEGGLRRYRYAYIPYYLRFLTLAREISPSVFDRVVLYFIYRS